jgi:tetratricopeptide (TPR) repeat protein/DNA-binding XRE family transcriptional regulator
MDPGGADGFGVVLRRKRLAAGLTQEELAERAALSVRAIRDLERGASQPYKKTVARLAEALELGEEDGPAAAPGPAKARGPGGRGELAAAARRGTPVPAPQPGVTPVPGGPRQLPPGPADFTGRSAELKTLTGLLEGDRLPGAMVVSAIGGTAGVGKTALAVHWAHRVAGRFPDGQLYVNLRGYDPGQPMPPADALAAFLRALGVLGHDIPADAEERAARYRSLIAGRRMLVLLDNAGSAEQVRPLLPASADCLTLVTSRDSLAGLIARDGARRLDLDLLSPTDADRLLTTLIGDRAAHDPQATAALAIACARLPLALRIAAELAVARPDTSLASLVAELTDEQRRLDLLDADGDRYTAVRAVFSWSYRRLEPDTARTFRLLGLHPGTSVDLYAAAALTGTGLAQARHLLGALSRAYLIYSTTPDHYGLHDLLREYGRGLAAEIDGPDECRAALTRLFDHYLHTSAAAMDTLFPAERHRRPRAPAAATPVPPVTEQAAARAWLEDRQDALIATVVHTTENGWPGHAARLATTVSRHLDAAGHYAQATIVHTCARRAAQQAGDRSGEAHALLGLAIIDLRQGRYRQAADGLRQAESLFRDTGELDALSRTLHNLGIIDLQEGRYPEAARHHEQALALSQQIGDRAGEARTLGNLVLIALHQGHYRQAAENNQRALALSQEAGDVTGEAYARHNLGLIEQRQGRYADAIGHHRQALALFRRTGDVSGEAYALADMGDANRGQGRYTEAIRHHRQALVLFRRTGDRAGEAAAYNGLGEVRLATGRPDRAYAQHNSALELAREVGDKCEWARAHDGLGHACRALGDPGQARQHWTEAVALYTGIGDPEAAKVQATLAEPEPGGAHGQPGELESQPGGLGT